MRKLKRLCYYQSSLYMVTYRLHASLIQQNLRQLHNCSAWRAGGKHLRITLL